MSKPTGFSFDKKTLAEFEEIAGKYPKRDAAILPALWLVQRENGYVTTEAAMYVAGLVGVAPAKVLETLQFYTMYQKQKPGRYHVQVCRTLSCMLSGAEDLQKVIEKKLGIKTGGTTKDGMFSYQQVECLAACHNAPCVQVNDEYHENLTPAKMEAMLEELRKK